MRDRSIWVLVCAGALAGAASACGGHGTTSGSSSSTTDTGTGASGTGTGAGGAGASLPVGTGGTGLTTTTTTTTTTTETADPDGPVIAAFTTSEDTVTPLGGVTFFASVTDPQGPSDIASAVLLDDMGNLYGPMTSSGASTFSIVLSWYQIHDVSPIQFEPPAGSRTFRAVFTDQAGHAASATKIVFFSCDGTTFCNPGACASCDGACQRVDSDAACGSCANVCAFDEACTVDLACVHGTWTSLIDTTAPGAPQYCAKACEGMGKACAPTCFDPQWGDGLAGVGYEASQSLIPAPMFANQCYLMIGDYMNKMKCCCG